MMRAADGFRTAKWDEALDFTARRLRELQEKYGPDSVAVYGGASLTTEKSYLLGKFARVGLKTRHIDYNGRLCMVSARTAYKTALGVDRAPNPWNDIAQAEILMAIGANVGECAPITTDYIWRARDHGAKLIVADPRFTPIARNADLYLPVRPGPPGSKRPRNRWNRGIRAAPRKLPESRPRPSRRLRTGLGSHASRC